jgi:APA family basic amino acid/polyamine antiporter
MGFWTLVIYGVGDMIGAGIYGTVGKAAGQMGNAVWIAFGVSMIAAMLTGLSYASIASRYPRAAGAAYVTNRAFGWVFLAYFVGLVVTASGLTSMATSTNAFSGVLAELTGLAGSFGRVFFRIRGYDVVNHDVGVIICIFGFLGFMTAINFWGIRESMWANIVCTAVEVGGLLLIIIIGMKYWGTVDLLETPPGKPFGAVTVFSGAVLTFFAFVGFEDMLNVAEEVKNPERTMPWGIVTALIVVAVIYIAISITAVSVAHYTKLAANPAPLSEITAVAATWMPPWVYKVITMFAVANTVLINYIMGSRLLYGMSRQGMLPAALGKVHHTRRTPHVAILTLLCIVSVLALLGNVADLATTTGLLLLGCFIIVNASLIALKLRRSEPKGRFEVPVIVPILGILINAALIAARLYDMFRDPKVGAKPLWIALILTAVVAILYLVMRPKVIPEEEPA